MDRSRRSYLVYSDQTVQRESEMSCSSSSGSEEDEEGMESYRKGGYHAVRVGDQFAGGRYIAQRKLGWGQYSTVWLAYDTRTSVRSISLFFFFNRFYAFFIDIPGIYTSILFLFSCVRNLLLCEILYWVIQVVEITRFLDHVCMFFMGEKCLFFLLFPSCNNEFSINNCGYNRHDIT